MSKNTTHEEEPTQNNPLFGDLSGKEPKKEKSFTKTTEIEKKKLGKIEGQTELFQDELRIVVTANKGVTTKKNFIPNQEVKNILDFVSKPGGNLVIDATAGSGKTTILEQIAELIFSTDQAQAGEVALLAFNKEIVKENQKRFPNGIDIRTINSLGAVLIQENSPKVPFFADKYVKLCEQEIKKLLEKFGENLDPTLKGEQKKEAQKQENAIKKEWKYALEKSVNLSMTNILPVESEYSEWLETMQEYDLLRDLEIEYNTRLSLGVYQDFPEERLKAIFKSTFQIIQKGMDLMIRPEGYLSERNKNGEIWSMTYIDQIYAPFHHGWTLKNPFKWILVDEAQDLSIGQIALVVAAGTEKSRIIAVGDRFQAIYNFSGSLADSIENLKAYFNAASLTLSISHRCPKTHTALARKNCNSTIQSSPQAKEGKIATINVQRFYDLVKEGDLVICRVSAPLTNILFDLLDQGIKAHLRGYKGDDLVEHIKKAATWNSSKKSFSESYNKEQHLSKKDLQEALDLLENQLLEEENRKYNSSDQDKTLIAQKFTVIRTALNAFTGQVAPKDWIKLVRERLSEKSGGAILCTIHKAKGLESNTVFVLYPEMRVRGDDTSSINSQAAKTALEFVSLTRSKENLYFVNN